MRLDSASADRVTALVLFVLGVVVLAAGYTMDRLEFRNIAPSSIPGLVPMVLGLVLALLAVGLFASASDVGRAAPEAGSTGNLLIAGGWSIVYAVGLVGFLSFPFATAVYVAGFVMIFDASGRPPIRRVLLAVVFGGSAAGLISALFRYGFLVRLP